MITHTSYEVIPYEMICKAANGEIDALNTVITHYSSYIKKVSQRRFLDTCNKIAFVVDTQLKQRIENSLINAILKFRL